MKTIIKGIEVTTENNGLHSGKISAPSIKLEAEFKTGYYEEPEAAEHDYWSIQAPVYYNGALDGTSFSITIDGSISSDEAHECLIEEVTRCKYCGEATSWIPSLGRVIFFCPKCGTEETIKV